MFTFLLIVHAIIAAALVGVILMQRSEGGGLGVGGSPSGLMSARGAADFLTRATTILASLFILMSIGLAALATVQRAPRTIDTSLARQAPVAPAVPASPVPMADPLAAPAAPAPAPSPAAPVQSVPARSAPVAPAPKASPAPAQPRTVAPVPVVNVPAAPAKTPVLVVPPKPAATTNQSSVPLAE